MNGMLFFLFILLVAVVVGTMYFRSRNRKPMLASNEIQPQVGTKNFFKEEYAMEHETFEENVKSAELAKIERVAAAKVEEEIGEELAPLKSQLDALQSALTQIDTGSQNQAFSQSSFGNVQQQPSELLNQMQHLSSQAQQQQQKTFQQLQQTIHQTAQMLGNVEQSLQTFSMLNQITQQINQSQQQIQQQQQQIQQQRQLQQMQGQSSTGQFSQQDSTRTSSVYQ